MILTFCFTKYDWHMHQILQLLRGHRGRDRVVVGFTIIYAISAYHHWFCGFQYRS